MMNNEENDNKEDTYKKAEYDWVKKNKKVKENDKWGRKESIKGRKGGKKRMIHKEINYDKRKKQNKGKRRRWMNKTKEKEQRIKT